MILVTSHSCSYPELYMHEGYSGLSDNYRVKSSLVHYSTLYFVISTERAELSNIVICNK